MILIEHLLSRCGVLESLVNCKKSIPDLRNSASSDKERDLGRRNFFFLTMGFLFFGDGNRARQSCGHFLTVEEVWFEGTVFEGMFLKELGTGVVGEGFASQEQQENLQFWLRGHLAREHSDLSKKTVYVLQ